MASGVEMSCLFCWWEGLLHPGVPWGVCAAPHGAALEGGIGRSPALGCPSLAGCGRLFTWLPGRVPFPPLRVAAQRHVHACPHVDEVTCVLPPSASAGWTGV